MRNQYCSICGQYHDLDSTGGCPLPVGELAGEINPMMGTYRMVRAATDIKKGEIVIDAAGVGAVVTSLSELQRLQQESTDLRRAMELIDKYERLLWIRALIGFQIGFLVGLLLYWMLS